LTSTKHGLSAAAVDERTPSILATNASKNVSAVSSPALVRSFIVATQDSVHVLPQLQWLATTVSYLRLPILVLLAGIKLVLTPHLSDPSTAISSCSCSTVAALEHSGSSLRSGAVTVEPRCCRLVTPLHTTRRGAYLSSSVDKVTSYSCWSESTDASSYSADGAHSRLLSTSSRKRSASKPFHARVLTSTTRGDGRGSGSWNRTSEWSEYSSAGRTSTVGSGRSDLVTTTSSVWPSLCVGWNTDWQRPNVSRSSLNRLA